MPIKHKPFERQNLEKQDDILNVRLNTKDRRLLEKYKKLIGNDKDSTALKLALFHSCNVLQREFSGDIRVHLFKKRTINDEIVDEI